MTVVEHMKFSILELMILSLLKEKEKTVTQLCLELDKPAQEAHTVPRGIVLSHLFGLMKMGFVAKRKKKVNGKIGHIYYHLSDPGRNYLENMITEALPLCDYMAGVLAMEKEK